MYSIQKGLLKCFPCIPLLHPGVVQLSHQSFPLVNIITLQQFHPLVHILARVVSIGGKTIRNIRCTITGNRRTFYLISTLHHTSICSNTIQRSYMPERFMNHSSIQHSNMLDSFMHTQFPAQQCHTAYISIPQKGRKVYPFGKKSYIVSTPYILIAPVKCLCALSATKQTLTLFNLLLLKKSRKTAQKSKRFSAVIFNTRI